jgi:hypothetical protein
LLGPAPGETVTPRFVPPFNVADEGVSDSGGLALGYAYWLEARFGTEFEEEDAMEELVVAFGGRVVAGDWDWDWCERESRKA